MTADQDRRPVPGAAVPRVSPTQLARGANGPPSDSARSEFLPPESASRDDPILAATQDALLPETSATSQEGYIRVQIKPDQATA